MTYRQDSDIWTPYGRIVNETNGIASIGSTPLLPVSLNKTKDIAWLVSNCHTQSKRELFVEAMQKYIPVDIYGRCGQVRKSLTVFN